MLAHWAKSIVMECRVCPTFGILAYPPCFCPTVSANELGVIVIVQFEVCCSGMTQKHDALPVLESLRPSHPPPLDRRGLNWSFHGVPHFILDNRIGVTEYHRVNHALIGPTLTGTRSLTSTVSR